MEQGTVVEAKEERPVEPEKPDGGTGFRACSRRGGTPPIQFPFQAMPLPLCTLDDQVRIGTHQAKPAFGGGIDPGETGPVSQDARHLSRRR